MLADHFTLLRLDDYAPIMKNRLLQARWQRHEDEHMEWHQQKMAAGCVVVCMCACVCWIFIVFMLQVTRMYVVCIVYECCVCSICEYIV